MSRALDYFERVEQVYLEAAQQVGEERYSFHIGEYIVSLRFAGGALQDAVLPAFAHLPQADNVIEADVEFLLWDTASTAKNLPEKPWPPDYETVGGYGEVTDFNTPYLYTIEQEQRYHGVDVLHLYDAKRCLGIFYTPDARNMPYWMRSFPLRVLLHCWTLAGDNQLVHGAAVGLDSGGVLLAGRGGSGKSTSALACLESDLSYAGDDYVMVSLQPRPFVYSLYNTAKVEADNLARLPFLNTMLANPDSLGSEKALLFLHEYRPDKLIDGFPLNAIVHPVITNRDDTSLAPSTNIKALTELAPTTIFQLRTAREQSFRRLTQLARTVPVYVLQLGTDLAQIPQVLSELLDSLDQVHTQH